MFIAKNKSGEVILFYKKPNRYEDYWLSQDGKYFNIDSCIGEHISYEDEPIEVRLTTDENLQYIFDLGFKAGQEYEQNKQPN